MRFRRVYRHNRRVRTTAVWPYATMALLVMFVGGCAYQFRRHTSPVATQEWRRHGWYYTEATPSDTSDTEKAETAPPKSIPTPAKTAKPGELFPMRNQKFGLAYGGELGYIPQAELIKYLDDAASMGVGWIRFDMAWSEIQPDSPTTYDWNAMDRIVAAANARNLRLLPILAYTPAWARPAGCKADDKCAPASNDAFAAFAATAVKRYASQNVHHWEIWNEPNLHIFWKPTTSASAYTALLKKTYAAIKTLDPSATVISGGLASTATEEGSIAQLEFFDGMYKAGAKGSFDAVGYHPYSFPALPKQVEPWNAWSKMADLPYSLRSIMAAHGDSDKPVWPTEFGAPTGGPGILATLHNQRFADIPDHVDEALQAQMAASAAAKLTGADWDGPLFWYSYKDLGTSKSTTENFYGLLRADGSKKPAYDIFTNLLKAR